MKDNDQISPSSRQIDDLFNSKINDDDDESNETKAIKQLCDLVKKCFCWLPKERIKMEDILNHPFIINPDVTNVEPPNPTLSAR